MKASQRFKKAGKKVHSAVQEVMLEFLEFMDDITFAQHHLGMVMQMGAQQARACMHDEERFRAAWDRRRTIKRLRERKWVKARHEGEKIIYNFTKNGAIAALETIMRLKEQKLPLGQYCLVAYDIPEGAREVRQVFRRTLKQCGCVFDQRSVWRTDKDIRSELKEFVRLLKIDRWVHIYLAHRI